MRELEGLSYEDMAQAMGCSKGTIMSRLFHARRNMQKRLLDLIDNPSAELIEDLTGVKPEVEEREERAPVRGAKS
jgi:RNA polymerase sigma-70 factor (ECF subfamily)